jgi:hypothetical protein
MSFANPAMEMNLYRVEIVHDINLARDGDHQIFANQIDSPFMNPEILPSTRVGRWQSIPHLENYVELDIGQPYKIRLFNYTWKWCVAAVAMNGQSWGQWLIEPRQSITIKGPNGPSWLTFEGHDAQTDLITVRFEPEQWNDRNLTHLRQPSSHADPMFQLDGSRETLMSIRLVAKRRYNPYSTVVALREDCPVYGAITFKDSKVMQNHMS